MSFALPTYNEVVALYTMRKSSWSAEEFIGFLSERIVSRDRRDIERLLFRMGLSSYDIVAIAEITKGIHPKDLLWIANDENERFDTVMTDVFSSVFLQGIDMIGESVDTPEGYNVKRYGVYEGRYGIYKQRISPLATDAESEVAVSLLGNALAVQVCPVYKVDADTVFSVFMYDFTKEYIVHFRRLLHGKRSENEYQNMISVRPQLEDDISRMILLDFITRQDDRHLSNIAIKVNSDGESFYPLYDNGRSLFYEDREEMVSAAVDNPVLYATGFGYSGTYWDYVQEIAQRRGGLSGLINMDVTEKEVADILLKAGFYGYRLSGAIQWITKTLHMVRDLSR